MREEGGVLVVDVGTTKICALIGEERGKALGNRNGSQSLSGA